jgi:hypothetical protein
MEDEFAKDTGTGRQTLIVVLTSSKGEHQLATASQFV